MNNSNLVCLCSSILLMFLGGGHSFSCVLTMCSDCLLGKQGFGVHLVKETTANFLWLQVLILVVELKTAWGNYQQLMGQSGWSSVALNYPSLDMTGIQPHNSTFYVSYYKILDEYLKYTEYLKSTTAVSWVYHVSRHSLVHTPKAHNSFHSSSKILYIVLYLVCVYIYICIQCVYINLHYCI